MTMKLQVNVYVKSFSKEGAEEVGVDKISDILLNHGIKSYVYLDTASLKVERDYDPDGEPNLEFDCYFTVEVEDAKGYTKNDIQSLIETNFE